MALLHTHFFSETLGMQCTMDVILPQRRVTPVVPVLWLLHGLSDDHSIWQRRTSIERYVEPLNLAVLMPNVHRSFYMDMKHGYRYETFLVEELPAIAASLFRTSTERASSYVAGLSMGGYGAFKLALRHPARYAAAASLSGALDMAARWRSGERAGDMELIYGDDPSGTEGDLMYLASRLMEGKEPRPQLFQCCGTEDFLYRDNLTFRDYSRRIGLSVEYREGPGAHTWSYWDATIQEVLAWMPLQTPVQDAPGMKPPGRVSPSVTR